MAIAVTPAQAKAICDLLPSVNGNVIIDRVSYEEIEITFADHNHNLNLVIMDGGGNLRKD